MPWKNKFKQLTPITNLYDQEFKGDYTGIIYSPFWDADEQVYIEEKHIEHSLCFEDALFIETWSCRTGRNVGWIYKQTETEYLFCTNNKHCYSVDYPKLRKIWYNLYPHPLLHPDYKTIERINNSYQWSWNRTQQKNQSEGYYIPIDWFYENSLILEKW